MWGRFATLLVVLASGCGRLDFDPLDGDASTLIVQRSVRVGHDAVISLDLRTVSGVPLIARRS